ncbi:MAG: hypothetical protein AAFN74_20390, partial [Myxococcota bacterium]
RIMTNANNAPTGELKRWIVADILTGLTAGHWERVPAAGAWAAGFAPFALEDAALSGTAARLTEMSPEVLSSFDALRQRFGRRGAEAAGWVAWRALAEVGGPLSVKALANALFSRPLRASGAALVRARWLEPESVLRASGVDAVAFKKRWVGLIEAHAADFVHSVQWNLPPPRFERPDGLTPRLTWSALPIDFDVHRVELRWSVASDLHPYAVPHDRLHAVRVVQALGSQVVFLDPRLRIIATWVVDGEVQGWAEVVR